MEEEELNEEVMGEAMDMADTSDTEEHFAEEVGGEETPEEPKPDMHYAEMEELKQHIKVLEDRISSFNDTISTMIESGATVMETSNPTTDEDMDKEEPYLYLEDLDYRM